MSPTTRGARRAVCTRSGPISWRVYLPFRSLRIRLTMSFAVRSKSFDWLPLAGAYADHTTCRDLAHTRNTVPWDRPNEDVGAASLLTVSVISVLGATSSSTFLGGVGGGGGGGVAGFAVAGGGGGGGVGNSSSSFVSKPSPIWSVSSCIRQLQGRSRSETLCPVVSRFARYLVQALGHAQHIHRVHVAPARLLPTSGGRTGTGASCFIDTSFILLMIPRRAALLKSWRHV